MSKMIDNALTRGNKPEIVGWGAPDYGAGISVDRTSQTYTAPVSGIFVRTFLKVSAGNGQQYMYLNTNERVFGGFAGSSQNNQTSIVPMRKNDVLTWTNDGDSVCVFYPLIGEVS